MNTKLLVDSIVRQTTVLIAQLCTAAGVRAPLAQIADQVFLGLSRELETQGVGRKVAADMFGLALRSYQKKVQRLTESETQRDKTLWEAIIDYLREQGGAPRRRIFERFQRDDESAVAAILNDLVSSGLAYSTGRGGSAVFGLTSAVDRELMADEDQGATLPAMLWLVVDLSGLDAEDRPFARYLSLADLANACTGSLDGDRAALSKLINSLSLSARLTQPVAVDAAETLYRIDLRDYDWDRQIAFGGTRFDDAWEAVIASSPYALPFVGDDADDASSDTGTAVPVLLGSAFVAAAASAPLYYALLDVPADLDDLLSDGLGIDVAGARAAGETVRAGFVADGLGGETQFLAERFDIEVRAGVAWQISEFGGDLFDDPLGNASGERELVFTLPNGLQGHVVADANGRVKNASDVVIDVTQSDLHARVADSFLRLRAQGVSVQDEVRPFVLANPRNFNRAERDAILAVYPAEAELQTLLDADRNNFLAASLSRLGQDINDAPEPVSQTFANFDADVDLATAAGELMVTAADLLNNLALLDPVLSVLDGGRIDRGDFDQFYASSACILTTVLENQVDPAVCDLLFQ